MTHYRISGYDYNLILMDAGTDPEKMKKLAIAYVAREYKVASEDITNIIVDKVDGVILVIVKEVL